MAMSYKSLSLGLLASLIIGAGLGAYGAIQWKERETVGRVAEAVQLEQERQKELYEERDALLEKVERQRLGLELAGIAVDVERKNFGLAQERLTQFGEDLETLAVGADAARAESIRTVVARIQEIAADLEALDPQVVAKLHQLFGGLQDAVAE